MRCPFRSGDNKKNRNNYLPSVSGVLLHGVHRGTCVARWVCRQVRMWLDTAHIYCACRRIREQLVSVEKLDRINHLLNDFNDLASPGTDGLIG